MIPLPPAVLGCRSGVGSLPGDDFDAAVELLAELLPEFPHVPELPAAAGGGMVDLALGGATLAEAARDPGLLLAVRQTCPRGLDALVRVLARGGFPDARAVKTQLLGPASLEALLLGAGAAAGEPLRQAVVHAVLQQAEAHHARLAPAGLPVVLQLDEPLLGTVASDAWGLLAPRLAERGLPTFVHACGRLPEDFAWERFPFLLHVAATAQTPATLARLQASRPAGAIWPGAFPGVVTTEGKSVRVEGWGTVPLRLPECGLGLRAPELARTVLQAL